MIVRHIARFESSLPKDLIEDEEGNFSQPPGKSVADAIAEIFRKLGCERVDGPDPVLDVTWEMGVQKSGRQFGVWLNLVEEYWLWLEQRTGLDKLFRRYSPVYLDFLRDLARELEADPRFSDVVWFTKQEEAAEAGGAGAPIESGAGSKGRRR